jgi:predicted secreted protein
MSLPLSIAVYFTIWWVTLFAVLPFWTRTVAQADEHTGWRGAPEHPRLLRKALATTIVATIVWFGAYLLIRSPYLSFRHGWLAPPPE